MSFLVSGEYLRNQRYINDLVRRQLGRGGDTRGKDPEGQKVPRVPDIRLVRTPEDGIKGFKYDDPRIYGAACRVIEVYDSEDMVNAKKFERRLRYLKAGGQHVEEEVFNYNINPVPGNMLVEVDQTIGGDYVVIGREWELPAVVAEDFDEAEEYISPVLATVNVMVPTGNAHPDPDEQEYKVTGMTLDVVVRGTGVGLDRGTPCRVRTVMGVWMFSWLDCAVDETLLEQLDAMDDDPVDFPDPFDV